MFLDRDGRSNLANLKAEASHNVTSPVAYKAASLASQETYGWRPPLTSGESSTLYDRHLAGTRADDLARNDPHARAGIMRLVDMLIGAGIHLTPQPNARALGLDRGDDKQRVVLHDLAGALKSEWQLFAEDPSRRCDAQRRLSLNGLLRLKARTFVTKGESTGYLTWRPEGAARYATCVRAIDPARLSNPMGQPDTVRLRGGIEYDEEGAPVAYHVRNAHPADWFRFAQALQWTRIPRATAWGRPVFIHGFEPEREDQSRAVTPFAALMTRLRMIGKFADTELASATINALFAAFVSSNLPLAEATAAFTPEAFTFADRRMAHYEKNPPHLNGVRIPIMPIGDKVEINASPRQTSAFHLFQAAFLQSIASALGLSYEQLAMDWSKTNYSSARAALNEVWRMVQRLFAQFVEQVVTPIYYAQVEEAFDRGYVTAPKGAPGFWDMPAAYLGARWIGPGRGYVDPVKEAEASSTRMGALTSTLERECAEQGADWEDVVDQIAREEAELKARGLTRIVAAPGRVEPDASVDKRPGDEPAKEAA